MASIAEIKTPKGQVFKSVLKKGSGIKFSFSIVTRSLLAVVLILEVYLAYNYLYKNIIFEDPLITDFEQSIVRVNFDQYNQVIERLDRVAGFYATSTIDFSGLESGLGRDNPFSDPQ